MAIPAQGLIRIYPSTVSITSGLWSVSGNGMGSASPTATTGNLQTYYDTRVDTPANAPRLKFADEIPAASTVFVPTNGNYELSFDPDTTRILFDPSGVAEEIDFLSASFPMGLLINQLRIHWNGGYTTGPDRNRQLTDISLKYATTTYKQVTPTPNVVFSGDIESSDTAIIGLFNNWGITQVLNTFGWSTTMSSVVAATLGQPQLRNDLFYLEGTYNTAFYNLSTNTPNALPGSIADITDGNAGLNTFVDFKIYWDDPNGDADAFIPGWAGGISIPRYLYLEFTNTLFRFIIPNNLGIPYGGKRLMLTGVLDGTLFSGEVPLQNYNIQLVDGSGLYKLVAGQPYDTYYDRSVSPVTTVNLKIPDWFAETGMFNS